METKWRFEQRIKNLTESEKWEEIRRRKREQKKEDRKLDEDWKNFWKKDKWRIFG